MCKGKVSLTNPQGNNKSMGTSYRPKGFQQAISAKPFKKAKLQWDKRGNSLMGKVLEVKGRDQ